MHLMCLACSKVFGFFYFQNAVKEIHTSGIMHKEIAGNVGELIPSSSMMFLISNVGARILAVALVSLSKMLYHSWKYRGIAVKSTEFKLWCF